jgi:hypothetical protein
MQNGLDSFISEISHFKTHAFLDHYASLVFFLQHNVRLLLVQSDSKPF